MCKINVTTKAFSHPKAERRFRSAVKYISPSFKVNIQFISDLRQEFKKKQTRKSNGSQMILEKNKYQIEQNLLTRALDTEEIVLYFMH